MIFMEIKEYEEKYAKEMSEIILSNLYTNSSIEKLSWQEIYV